ncbi:MAG: DUF3368 domain-containing protein [Bacteroidia bacterium]
MIVVSDTSPVSNLLLIDKLQILHKIFDEIIIPAAVDREVKFLKKLGRDISSYENAEWIIAKQLSDYSQFETLKLKLDIGEAEAIALALEVSCDLILIDERLGTSLAKQAGLKTIGLAGVLVLAKQRGIIKELKPIMLELKTKAGFWLGEKLLQQILSDNGE